MSPTAKTRPPAPARPAADPVYEAARATFEALSEPTRKAIQGSLVWTGDFNAVVSGAFGRRTYEGVLAWQRRQGREPDGLLSAKDRAALDASGEAARKAMRFTVQADPASGAVIGVPEKLLSKKSPLPRGTRWQSADGRVTLDTTAYPPGDTDLDALFERATTATPERKVTYKLKKPDFLVVTGETPAGRFYIRQAAGAQGIRGFTMSYDKALTAEVDRLVIAVANSFVPFSETPSSEVAAAVALATKPAVFAAPSGAKPTGTPFTPPPLPGSAVRPAATGLALGGGRVLTAAVETCPAPRIGGAPARVASRDASGALALLETQSRTVSAPALAAIRPDVPLPGEALVVLGAEAKGSATVAPGTAGTGSVFAPLQPGAGGAPVLDRSGHLVGLVARFPTAPRLIAGVMPPTSYALVPGSTIATFLAQAGVATGKAAPARPNVTASLGAAGGSGSGGGGRDRVRPIVGTPKWTAADIPPQHGRLAIVTGATSGIGYEAALALAEAGAQVVLAARDAGRAERAMAAIWRVHPSASLEFRSLDTASLSSVRAFAEAWWADGRPIGALLLNAGIAWLPQRQETEDGFERQLAANFLGHFALTGLLLPNLRPGPASRIIPVASIAHQRGTLRFDDLQSHAYKPRSAYRQSKLAMLMFGLELDRRLRAAGSEIRAIPVHPGITRTAIIDRGGGAGPLQRLTGRVLLGLLGQSAAHGALPLLYAATAPDAVGGAYYGPDGIWEARGFPAVSEVFPHARDEADARLLWAESETLTGVDWLS